jgi:hypothetical protein
MFDKYILNANQAKICFHYYKLHIKLQKIILRIEYNKKCINLNITPKYAIINLKQTEKQTISKTKEYAQKFRVKQEIKNAYYQKNQINLQLYITHLEIVNTLGNVMYNNIKEEINNKTREFTTLTKSIHNRKITKLINNKNRTQNNINIKKKNNLNYKHNLKTHQRNKFDNKMVNLTNIEFEDTEKLIITNAYKYCLPCHNNNTIIKNTIIDTETNLYKIENENEQESIRNNIKYNINENIKHKHNNKANNKINEINLYKIKQLKNKITQHNAIIIKSDKTNTPVIINQSKYIDIMNKYIEENNYIELKDPTNKYLKITKNLITKHKDIFNYKNNINYHTRLYPFKPAAPKLTGLPKIHKPNIPIRPLINFKTAPTYHIAKIIDKILRSKIKLNNTYNVKNGYETILKLQQIKANSNTKMVSYDISNMYTNIPINKTIKIIKNTLEKQNENTNFIHNLITIIRNICKQNYFEFNNKYYSQPEGLPMGAPLSAIMSEIYIQDFENKIVYGITHTHNIILWIRYVDDILCIYNNTVDNEYQIILNKLNSYNSQLRFTVETENNRTIHFLDIKIEINNNIIETNVYRKPTTNNTTIHNKSNHPWTYKINTYTNMINRAIIYTQGNKQKMDIELKYIKQIARENGYNENLIKNIYNKIKNKSKIKEKTTLTDNYKNNDIKNKKYLKYKYTNKIVTKFTKAYNKENYTVAYKSNKCIINYLQNKTINKNNACGVYKIKCDQCEFIYIGKTNRSFKNRYDEHLRAYKYKNIKYSNVAEHLINNNHTITSFENNLEILEINNNNKEIEHLEKFYIYKYKDKHKLMNHHVVFENDDLYKLATLISWQY